MSQPFFEWREAPEAAFAVLGDPISHSLSPAMHTASLAELGRSERYVAIRVPAEELTLALARFQELGYIGVNLTIPLKVATVSFCSDLDSFAKRVGAVNTLDLRTMRGRNTDGPGFWATLASLNLNGKRAVVLGAGGSARAIMSALSEGGLELSIWNRTRTRAEQLVQDLGLEAAVMDVPEIRHADLVVNCLSGVAEAEAPIDWVAAKPELVCYDLMYGAETPFQKAARGAKLTVVDGLQMLVEQGALSMEGWLGEPVDRSVMLRGAQGVM